MYKMLTGWTNINAGCFYSFPDYNTTSDGWLVWRGSQYFINRLTKPMEEARHFCQQRHGELATVNSNDENIFLWKQVGILWVWAIMGYFIVYKLKK